MILLAGRAPTLAAETVPEEILEPFKLVKLAPLDAGSVAGNLLSGTVPEARSEASRFVRLAPLIAGKVPVRLAAGILPDPVILLPLRSKLPPSCGDVSVTRSAEMRTVAIPAEPVVAVTVTPADPSKSIVETLPAVPTTAPL